MTIKSKFRVTDPGIFWSLQTIDQLGEYSFSAPQFDEIDDVYLDTKNRRLLAEGYYCRQRSRAKGCSISLIEFESIDGVDQRSKQWDLILKRNNHNPNDWPESKVRKKVLKIVSDKKLRPIFTLHQNRISRLISKWDQVIARAIIDNVSVDFEGNDQQFKTVKIVILIPDGNENHLETLTADFQAKWQLETESRSKFEQIILLELDERH
jgi:inorganic triphosphatase YgiF